MVEELRPSVCIHLCGGLRIDRDGERVESLLTRRKSRELLALLLLTERATSRSRLIELLWPEQPQGSRDGALRQLLTELRDCLGPSALAGASEVSLGLPASAWVDVREARAAAERAGDALEAGDFEVARSHAANAVAALSGELLVGHDADWLEEQRDAVREIEVSALEVLARACLSIQGREREAVSAARQTVSRAPFRESGQSLLMRALVAEGNVAEALLVYERWRVSLNEELGIAPSVALSALHVWALEQASPVGADAGGDEEPQTLYARRPDGVSVAYQVLGTGPVDVVNVPGFMSHLDMQWANPEWRQWAYAISAHARVIFLDKAGTGASDPVDHVPTIEEWAGDVLAVLDAVDSERAVVLAMSESAATGAYLACEQPDRVRGLILYGAMVRMEPAPDYLWEHRDELRAATRRFAEVEFTWGRGASMEMFAPARAVSEKARRAWAIFERACASPTAVARRVQAISSVDARQYLPGIALPTLVIHRAGDRAVPVHHGRYLAGAIQGARYLEMPGGDHVPSAEEAQVLLGAFAEFLADPAVATPGARPGTLVERPT